MSVKSHDLQDPSEHTNIQQIFIHDDYLNDEFIIKIVCLVKIYTTIYPEPNQWLYVNWKSE